MNSIQTVNGILATISFVLLFSSYLMDLLDKRHGNIIRRVVIFVMLLGSCSVLIRVGERQIQQVVFIWVVVAGFIFISKVVQFRNKTKVVDDKVRKVLNSIGKSSANKHAAH